MYPGEMMLESGRDWWRTGMIGPAWRIYYPDFINGFDAVDFDNWILHSKEDPSEWYRNTTDYLYGDSSGTIGAGHPDLMTYRYRTMKIQHGKNVPEYTVKMWIKTAWVITLPATWEVRFSVGLGTATYYYDVMVIQEWAIGSWSEPWTHYKITFYQDDVTLHRMVKVEKWDGTSWVFVRERDFGVIGNWSGLGYFYIEARTPGGGKVSNTLDQLELWGGLM